MSTREQIAMLRLWRYALLVGGLAVVAVAALLGAIAVTAKSIDHNAEMLWTIGKQIAGNTVSIWMLDQTNKQLAQITQSVRALERAMPALERENGRGEG